MICYLFSKVSEAAHFRKRETISKNKSNAPTTRSCDRLIFEASRSQNEARLGGQLCKRDRASVTNRLEVRLL
jgi:hypothetical protein